jgi:hypothetical protein
MSHGHGFPLIYRALRFFGAPFRFHVAGLENIQDAELCAIHQRASGESVPIYPMAVHAGARQIAIDSPMFVEDNAGRRQVLERACAELWQRTLSLYRQLDAPLRSV